MAATDTGVATVGTKPLIKVEGLEKRFPVASHWFRRSHSYVHAVDGISFDLARGESFGLVGESGCGKTTTGRLLVRLTEPTDGRVLFDDGAGAPTDITTLRGEALKAFRRKAQMIFQDPYESLNPRRTIFDTVAEPLKVQNACEPLERLDRVSRMLEMVGLTPPSAYLFRFPHELSGGQRQRVAIARALVIEPIFVVADEPTSMLDVSIRTGVMHLMEEPGGSAGHQLPVHHARPGRGPLHVLADRGDVPGKDRGDGRHGGGAPAAQAPLYAGAAVSRAGPGSDRYPPPGQNRWRGLDSAGSATPLPFLQPLPDRGRLLPGQSASAAGGEGGGAGGGLLQGVGRRTLAAAKWWHPGVGDAEVAPLTTV